MIQLSSIHYTYPGQSKAILKDVDLEIEPGEVILLRGANGSGKTTLLKVLAGIVPKFSGGHLEGSRSIDARLYNDIQFQYFGMLFHGGDQQFIQSRVDQEILYTLESSGLTSDEVQKRFTSVVDDFDLEEFLEREIITLSSGETQLIKLALAFALEPKVLLMDEPLSHLDVEIKSKILQLLIRLHSKYGLTYVIADHEFEPWKAFGKSLRTIALTKTEKTFSPSQRKNTIQNQILIDIQDLYFSYGPKTIVSGFSKEIRKGELVVIQGNNGSGKTTLLELIAGQIKANAGLIDTNNVRFRMLVNPIIRNFFSQKVKDEIELENKLIKVRTVPFNVKKFFDRYVFDLSQGEQRKVALNLMMQTKPDLVLLDEPFLHLDEGSKEDLWEGIQTILDHGTTVVITTHEKGWLTETADQVWSMKL